MSKDLAFFKIQNHPLLDLGPTHVQATAHLDLPAIEQLEEALESFDGTVLLVTHDRRMLDTVRLTRRWRVDEGLVTEVSGT